MIRLSFWRRLLRASSNASFIVGSVMVGALIILAAVGPEIAPYNPYLRQRIQWFNGEMKRAPIEPRVEYPLGTDPEGRDQLSLLLYGARTTLMIALIATAVRLLLGMILGALCGWWPGGMIDRAVSSLTEFLAAIPGLILAILLVYAIGIRSGRGAFIGALAVVGWGEVAQIVRSHVLAMRNKEFVTAARAVGLSSLETLSRHILPNLMATMISISALEMGSALLLLGELGFMNVFLGSGTMIAGDVGTPSRVIFETPDWGAMLGSTWRSFRALPWLPAAPALAFFISILSFNLFGFGLQRFSERGRFYPSGWSVLRFVVISTAVLFGFQYVLAQTGPETQFKAKARAFDVSQAWADIDFLTQPQVRDRSTGTEARDLAASYIANQFQEADLTPFPYGSYFQPFQALHGAITAPPQIEIISSGGEVYQSFSDGIRYDPIAPFNNSGEIDGRLFLFGNISSAAYNRTSGLVFILGDNLFSSPAILRIVRDDLLPTPGIAPSFPAPFSLLGSEVSLVISESQAAEMMQQLGHDYYRLKAQLESEEEILFDTGATVRLRFGLQYENVQEVNVIGYMPGTDPRVQTQRIIVAAPYTVPAPYQGRVYPGADDNASGVSVMLEIMRQWRELDFQPKRTVVFAAFDELGGHHFVEDPILPSSGEANWTAVVIYGVGAGEDELARLAAGAALDRPFDKSARLMRTSTRGLADWQFFFAGGGGRGWELAADPSYAGIVITRPGDGQSGTVYDSRDHLDPLLLEDAGRTISHFLMVLSSE
jgi:peptide/nickel transport system permease protein